MHHRKLLSSCLAALLAGGVACGSQTNPGTGGGGATGGATSMGGEGGAPTGVGAGGMGGAGGSLPAERCATAEVIPGTSVKSAMVSFDQPGDRFYGKLSATAGSWLAIYGKPLLLKTDIVIRLWSEDGTELLASSDNFLPAFAPAYDGTMNHYVAETRNYCVEVLDYADWRGMPELGGIYSFELRARSVEDFWGVSQDVVRLDEGDNDTVATAQDLMIDPVTALAVILGTFDSEDDVDVYTLKGGIVDPDFQWRSFSISPTGKGSATSQGWGSTSDVSMTLLAPDGVTVVARRSASDENVACNFAPDSCFGILVPEVEGQDYILVVERKGGSLAPDDAYSIFSGQVGVPVTASEPLDDGSNDSLVNAEVLAPLVLDNEPSYLFEGTLDDGDVDWWYVPTSEPDETLRLWCGSSYFGTGIEGLTLDAYKDDATDGAPVQSETETAQRRIHWWGAHAKGTSLLPPLPGGTGYYFKLSSSSFSSIVTSRHYYCQIIHHSTAN